MNFIELLPMLVLGTLYALVVFLIARKRGVNPWVWSIATLVPFFGLIVAAVFMVLTLLSVLDRLSVLESRLTPATFE